MKFSNYVFFIVLCLAGVMLPSCKEKRVYYGTVVTQHDNPVQNASVTLVMIPATAMNGKTTDGEFHVTRTDGNGAFRMEMRAGRKYYVDEFFVRSDSGQYHATFIPADKENKIVLQ